MPGSQPASDEGRTDHLHEPVSNYPDLNGKTATVTGNAVGTLVFFRPALGILPTTAYAEDELHIVDRPSIGLRRALGAKQRSLENAGRDR